jgi:hypothetical protein
VSQATENASGRLWRRLRRPLGVVALAWIVIRNVDALSSGEPLPMVSAAALIAFFAWIFLRPLPDFSLEGITADQLRARNRREMTGWGFWTLVAVAVMSWASVHHGFSPPYLIVVSIPLIPVLINVLIYAKADGIVAKVAARQPGQSSASQ